MLMCAFVAACATAPSSAQNPPRHWDDPQPQCFVADAIAAGARLGSTGMPGDPAQASPRSKSGHHMDRQEVGNVVEGHIEEVRHCYARGLAENPQLHGNIVVRFTVGAGGKVIESAVATSTVAEESVESCVGRAVCRWIFEAPADGAQVVVNYPFELQSRAGTPH